MFSNLIALTLSLAPTALQPTARAAGGKFSWKENWYPVAFSKVTDKTLPTRVELFGEPIALWHDGDQWAAMADACPHRLAPLSEGRVDSDGQIECPYHGWTFNDRGECTKVPQLEETQAPEKVFKACGGVSYAVVERQGLVWLWGEPLKVGTAPRPDASTIPTCEALDDDRFVWIDVSRDMPYSADMLLENVLDSSHVPFTHHQTISKRENAVAMPLRLTRNEGARGFEGEFQRDDAVGEHCEIQPAPLASIDPSVHLWLQLLLTLIYRCYAAC